MVIYCALVAGYFFAVLHFLGDWLQDLFLHHRKSYAVLALLLIVMQGVVLEAVTRCLLAWLKRRAGE